ncbi:hypothetical protein Dimus_034875 [Dionaea muscipula]
MMLFNSISFVSERFPYESVILLGSFSDEDLTDPEFLPICPLETQLFYLHGSHSLHGYGYGYGYSFHEVLVPPGASVFVGDCIGIDTYATVL